MSIRTIRLQTLLADVLVERIGVKPVLEIVAPGHFERFSGKAQEGGGYAW